MAKPQRRLRAGEPAPNFDFETVDGYGGALGDFHDKTLALLFLRYIGCPICRLEIQELRLADEQFKSRDVEVMVVMDSPTETIRAYLDAQQVQLPFHLVGDPRRDIYRMYGVERATLMQYAAPAGLARSLKALGKGHMHGSFSGDERSLPAQFLIDRGKTILYAHYGRTIADMHPPDRLISILDDVRAK